MLKITQLQNQAVIKLALALVFTQRLQHKLSQNHYGSVSYALYGESVIHNYWTSNSMVQPQMDWDLFRNISNLDLVELNRTETNQGLEIHLH